VILSFADKGSEAIFEGEDTKKARKTCPVELWRIAIRKLDAINQASELKDLRSPPANHLEALKGNREGQHSLRINQQYRICFYWTAEGVEQVEITDYHS